MPPGMQYWVPTMSHDATFLVTGANGFIGGWLAEALYLTGGSGVRAGIHRWSGAARLARFPMSIVPCDVLVPDQLASAMDGVTCVLHCAKGRDETIVQETQNVLDAASRQGLRRLVYVSTTEVYGNHCGKIDETFPLELTGNSYADSKIEAENLCWEYHKRGLPVTVIRPSIVYGPFSATWTVNIARKLQSGNWGIFREHGDGVCNLIFITDLVRAILLAASDERAIGEAFNVNGPESRTWNEFFQGFNRALGLPELRIVDPHAGGLRAASMELLRKPASYARDHCEGPLRRAATYSRLARQVMKSLELLMKTSPRTSDFSLYSRDALYLDTKARVVLGYKPEIELDAGLDMCVRWLCQVGLSRSSRESS